MALCRRTRSFEVFAWDRSTSPEDTLTVTLLSGAKIVFRGIEEGVGKIASPAFKIDAKASDQISVQRLYEDTMKIFYYRQSRWWKFRNRSLRDPEWIKQCIEFAIQPSGYGGGIDQTQDLIIGGGLFVHFIIDDEVVRIPEIFPYVQVHGDANLAVYITQQQPHGSSTIVSIE